MPAVPNGANPLEILIKKLAVHGDLIRPKIFIKNPSILPGYTNTLMLYSFVSFKYCPVNQFSGSARVDTFRFFLKKE